MHACWRGLNDACCVVAAQKSAVCVSHKTLSWCIKVATESAVRSPLLLSKVCACCQPSLSPVLILLFIRQPTPSMAAWGPSKFLLLPKSPPMPPMRAPKNNISPCVSLLVQEKKSPPCSLSSLIYMAASPLWEIFISSFNARGWPLQYGKYDCWYGMHHHPCTRFLILSSQRISHSATIFPYTLHLSGFENYLIWGGRFSLPQFYSAERWLVYWLSPSLRCDGCSFLKKEKERSYRPCCGALHSPELIMRVVGDLSLRAVRGIFHYGLCVDLCEHGNWFLPL